MKKTDFTFPLIMATRKRPPVHYLPEVRKDEELDNLLVFGYQCKIFKDDERARVLDRGQHLIPWMGDSKIMIDRTVFCTKLWVKKVSICSDFQT